MKFLFNIKMLREEPDLVTMDLARAMLCTKCQRISNTRQERCTFCESDTLVRVADVIELPQGPPPKPSAAMGKVLPFAA
ncbi:MAG TPA: hypothetical protein VGM27_33710 [Acidobacteriaceae bacterium]